MSPPERGPASTTVSHVLSGKRPVAAATTERVRAAVDELGFRPNAAAQALSTSRSTAVALLVPDITNPFFPLLARGVQDALAPRGYSILLCNTDAERETERHYLEDVLSRGVDGIVAATTRLTAADLKPWRSNPVPLVSIGNTLRVTGVDSVRSDDLEGAGEAARLLLETGHTKIGIIAGPADQPPAGDRLEGFISTLDIAGHPVAGEYIVHTNFTTVAGREAAMNLLKLDPRPTALFCSNDLMAIGALGAARELGLAIPDQLAIVGYDDIPAAAISYPPLTTIVNPAYEMGWQAGNILLERMANPDMNPRHVVVPHRIAVRESARLAAPTES